MVERAGGYLNPVRSFMCPVLLGWPRPPEIKINTGDFREVEMKRTGFKPCFKGVD